jgi:hypothetical protein
MKKTINFTEYNCNYNKNENIYCKMIINVRVESYDNNEWYYIGYSYEYGSDDKSALCHPFYNYKKLFDEHSTGDILVKNTLSNSIINALFSSEDKLETGNVTYQQYLKQIMVCIASLYD